MYELAVFALAASVAGLILVTTVAIVRVREGQGEESLGVTFKQATEGLERLITRH